MQKRDTISIMPVPSIINFSKYYSILSYLDSQGNLHIEYISQMVYTDHMLYHCQYSQPDLASYRQDLHVHGLWRHQSIGRYHHLLEHIPSGSWTDLCYTPKIYCNLKNYFIRIFTITLSFQFNNVKKKLQRLRFLSGLDKNCHVCVFIPLNKILSMTFIFKWLNILQTTNPLITQFLSGIYHNVHGRVSPDLI